MDLKKYKIRDRLVTIATLIATAILIYFAYLLLSPQTPIKIYSTKILTPAVSSMGGVVKYEFKYCKYVTATSSVYRQLVGAGQTIQGYGFPSIEGVTQKGCRTQTILLPLPSGIAPGKYYIHGDIDYPVNSIRDVHTYYNTDSFEVTR